MCIYQVMMIGRVNRQIDMLKERPIDRWVDRQVHRQIDRLRTIRHIRLIRHIRQILQSIHMCQENQSGKRTNGSTIFPITPSDSKLLDLRQTIVVPYWGPPKRSFWMHSTFHVILGQGSKQRCTFWDAKNKRTHANTKD